MNYEKIEKILKVINFSYEFINGSHKYKKDTIIIIIENKVRYPNLGEAYTNRFKFYEKTKSNYHLNSFKTETDFYNFLHKKYKSEVRKIKIKSLLNH